MVWHMHSHRLVRCVARPEPGGLLLSSRIAVPLFAIVQGGKKARERRAAERTGQPAPPLVAPPPRPGITAPGQPGAKPVEEKKAGKAHMIKSPLQCRTMEEFTELFEMLWNTGFGVKFDTRTETETMIAQAQGASLLFGEVLPHGVSKIFDMDHLQGAKARVFYDLGSGPGKMALQAWFEFPNIDKIVAVELCESRYKSGVKAMQRLCKAWGHIFSFKEHNDKYVELTMIHEKDSTGKANRVLHFHNQNLFKFADDAKEADCVMLETDFPKETEADLTRLLGKFKPGCRVLLYKKVPYVYVCILLSARLLCCPVLCAVPIAAPH
jgi:hypothetical protein